MSNPDAGACIQCNKLGRRCFIATVHCVAELKKKAEASKTRAHAVHGDVDGKRLSSINPHVSQRISNHRQQGGDKAISLSNLDLSCIQDQCRTSSSESVYAISGAQLNDGLMHLDPLGAQSQSWTDYEHNNSLQWNIFGTQEQESLTSFTFDTFDTFDHYVGSKDLWNRSQLAADWSFYIPAGDSCQPTALHSKGSPETIVRGPQLMEPFPKNAPQLNQASRTGRNSL